MTDVFQHKWESPELPPLPKMERVSVSLFWSKLKGVKQIKLEEIVKIFITLLKKHFPAVAFSLCKSCWWVSCYSKSLFWKKHFSLVLSIRTNLVLIIIPSLKYFIKIKFIFYVSFICYHSRILIGGLNFKYEMLTFSKQLHNFLLKKKESLILSSQNK